MSIFFVLKLISCAFSRVFEVDASDLGFKGIDLNTNNVVVDGEIDHPNNFTASH